MNKFVNLKNLARQKVQKFINDEGGDISIKGIAITVATIVVIGAVVTWLASGGGMEEMIKQVWTSLGGWLDTTIGLGW